MNNNFLINQAMDVLTKSLGVSSLRQKVISNNIANINTPEYKRQYVSFEKRLDEFIRKDERIPFKTTNGKHISVNNIGFSRIEPQLVIDNSTTLRTDGNNVDIDLELALLSENTIRFNALSQAVNKKYSMLKSAIKGGR